MDLPGFDHLLAQCRALALTCELYEPAAQLPDADGVLGAPLDPCLRALLSRHNGGRVWDVYLYGGDGSPNQLLTTNRSLRRLSDDLPALADFVLFAQVGHQAAHLALLPALANAAGLQPAVYLDLNEAMRVLPLAANADRCFELLARYLGRLGAQSNGDLEAGAMELLFPWDVPELLADDEELLKLVTQGRFDRYTGADPYAQDFLRRARAHERPK